MQIGDTIHKGYDTTKYVVTGLNLMNGSVYAEEVGHGIRPVTILAKKLSYWEVERPARRRKKVVPIW